MALQREYFPSDTLKLINGSESLLVRSGSRASPSQFGIDESYGAHTIGRHLLQGAPGSMGKGVPFADFKDRFLNSPANLSSAWSGKGEMAVLLCELLNSAIGQFALGQLGRGSSRIVVHYLNEQKLAGLFGGLAGDAQFQESRVTVTAKHKVKETVPVLNSKNEPVMENGKAKTFERTTVIPQQKSASVSSRQITSFNAVFDRFGSSLHLQTFFPSSDNSRSFAEWRTGRVKARATQSASGPIQTQLMADS